MGNNNSNNNGSPKIAFVKNFSIIFRLLREEFITGQSLNEFATSPEFSAVAFLTHSHGTLIWKGNRYTHKKFIAKKKKLFLFSVKLW